MAAKKKPKKATSKTVNRRTAAKKPVLKKTPSAKSQAAGKKAAARKKATGQPGSRKGRAREIHCTVAPIEKERVLLPTSVIEEIMDYQPLSPLEGVPAWLLGQVEWENRQVPVIGYCALINGSEPQDASAKSRIMIIKSLSDSARVPYLGFLLSDIPTLAVVTRHLLSDARDDNKALGVFSRVTLEEEEEAVIPDLDRLIHLVTHAAFGVLPITQVEA